MTEVSRLASAGAPGLRDVLLALAADLGRPPSAAETRAVMARLGVSRDDVDSLNEAARSARPRERAAQKHARSSSAGPRPAGPVVPHRQPPAPPDEPAEPASALSPGAFWDDGGDPFALPSETAPLLPATSDPKVLAAIADLADDARRAGGTLAREDVDRLIVKRQLDSAQAGELLALLHENGLHPQDRPDPDNGADDGTERAGPGLDLVRTYLLEIAGHRLIYAEEEVRLGHAIRTGQLATAELAERPPGDPVSRDALEAAASAGRRAHEALVQANLPLVVSISKLGKYQWSGVDLLDRIQDGNIGLMRAADKFDATMGFKFSTYATWWIRQQIERGIADKGRLIRIPVHAHEQIQRLRATSRRLGDALGRQPTATEIAAELDIEPAKVQAMLDWSRPVVSLDQPVGPDGDTSLGDLLADDAEIDGRNDPADTVLHALMVRDVDAHVGRACGSDRNAAVIRARFGLGSDEPQTLEEIGREYGLTRERIRQIEEKALVRLRASPDTSALWEHLREHDYHRRTPPPPPPKKQKRNGPWQHLPEGSP